MFFHVSLVPIASGEQKTKPTQHSVKELRGLGLSPDVVVCRSKAMLCAATKEKMSAFCHVSSGNCISVHDVSNIYHVPLMLTDQDVHTIIKTRLKLDHMDDAPNLNLWRAMAETQDSLQQRDNKLEIAIVGKYSGQQVCVPCMNC